jgi:hypothetical protein
VQGSQSLIIKLNFFITSLCICCSLLSFGQSAGIAATPDSISTVARQYVKIEVGMHILDCPVLPKQLKEKLMQVKGIQGYREDAFTQCIYFNIPEGAITREQIVGLALGCAFPAQAVNVLINRIPFP